MKLSANCGVGAIFKCVVRKADTHEIVRETPEFHNLVLDAGLARMSVGTWIDRCCVGTGNSTPVASQVALDNFIASTTFLATGVSDTGGVNVATEPVYWYGRRTWRFAVGTATGNLSEIGLGWGNANLWNRALIKDNNGNPTTLTVLADEYLDVFCEIRIYPSNSSGSFNIVDKLNNIVSTHAYTCKPVLARGSPGEGAYWLASKVLIGSGGLHTKGFAIDSADMPDNYTVSIAKTFSKLSAYTPAYPTTTSAKLECQITSTEANMNHRSFQVVINGLMCRDNGINSLSYLCCYKWQINPAITKTSAMILTYSVTLNWGRYEPT